MANPTPAITFSVNLAPLMSEKIGPLTNESSVAVLHPDRFQSDQDNAVTENSNRSSLVKTYLPTVTVMPNRVWTHGDTFTEYGQKAVYLRDMYAVGYAPADRAYLTVVTVA